MPASRKLRIGEYPAKASIAALIAHGFSDREIGQHYRRSDKWGLAMRKRYGFQPARGPGGRPLSHWPVRPDTSPLPPPKPVEPIALPAPALQTEPVRTLGYDEFFATFGHYPSFTERQIERCEARWNAGHPHRAPAVVNVTRELFGDPKPGRAA